MIFNMQSKVKKVNETLEDIPKSKLYKNELGDDGKLTQS